MISTKSLFSQSSYGIADDYSAESNEYDGDVSENSYRRSYREEELYNGRYQRQGGESGGESGQSAFGGGFNIGNLIKGKVRQQDLKPELTEEDISKKGKHWFDIGVENPNSKAGQIFTDGSLNNNGSDTDNPDNPRDGVVDFPDPPDVSIANPLMTTILFGCGLLFYFKLRIKN